MPQEKLTRAIVVKQLEAEMANIAGIQKELNAGKIDDATESEDYRDPLSMDIFKEVKILLSWGGPEDGFKLQFDKDNKLIGGVYYMANWGEYQEVELEDNEAEIIFDFYMYGDTSILEG